jgi:hypothetical protein
MAPYKKAKTNTQPKKGAQVNDKGKGGKPQGRTSGPTKKDGWEWAPFTQKSVIFVQAAKTLAAEIHSHYGDNVSIAQYERYCVAVPAMTDPEKAMAHVSKTCIQALMNYINARDERDSERASFRSDVKICDVEGSLATLLTSVSGNNIVPSGKTPDKANKASSETGGDMDASE